MTAAPAARRTSAPEVRRSRPVRALAVLAFVTLAVFGAALPAHAAGEATWGSPLDPLVVIRGFDPPAGPYAPGHRGVDLAGSVDQAVRAAGDGVVTFAGQVGGVGVVSILHGPIRTTYQPIWGTTVRVGMPVGAGDLVGRLAPFGAHCQNPCLHWGAVLDDAYIDPLSLLDPPRSRLLPYWHSELGAQSSGGASAGSASSTHVVDRESGSAVKPIHFRLTDVAPATQARSGEPATAVAEQPRSVPAGVAGAIAVIGGVIGGAAFLAIRRRYR